MSYTVECSGRKFVLNDEDYDKLMESMVQYEKVLLAPPQEDERPVSIFEAMREMKEWFKTQINVLLVGYELDEEERIPDDYEHMSDLVDEITEFFPDHCVRVDDIPIGATVEADAIRKGNISARANDKLTICEILDSYGVA